MVEGDAARLRRHQEHYHAAVAFVDEQIGRILAALDELGLASDTLVLATTDHGEMLGDLDCFQKSCPYESAAHIPFMLRWPGVFRRGVVDREHFVDLNDVLPTFLDAAGVKYPGPFELPGSSLLDLSTGRDRSVQYMELGAGVNRWCALRDARFKYVYAYAGGWEALFDLQSDPREQRNLLVHGVPAEIRETYVAMRGRLVAYEERWGLANMTQWKDFIKIEPRATGDKSMNGQYPPSWLATLRAAERAELGDPLDEILAVTKDEPTVKLSKLSLDRWAAKCKIDPSFLERIRREGR
jgi:arylsulfatase A-like enzyme